MTFRENGRDILGSHVLIDLLIIIIKFWYQGLLSRCKLFFGFLKLSFLIIVAIRSQTSSEIEIIKTHVGVSIVPSKPVHDVFLFEV